MTFLVLEVAGVVFLLKLVVNAMVPIHLAVARDRDAGVSLMPWIEWSALVVWVACASALPGDRWFEDGRVVAGVGAGSLVVNYILVAVLSMAAGYWRARHGDRRSGE